MELKKLKKFKYRRYLNYSLCNSHVFEKTLANNLPFVIESLPHGLIITDLNASIIYTNQEIERITGYARSELIGESPGILNAENEADLIQEEILAAVSKNQRWHGELRQRHKDGSIYWADFQVFPILRNNSIIAWASIQFVTTQRKEAEIRAKEIQDNTQLILESIPEALFITSSEGRIIKVNEAACQLLGFEREELLEKNIIQMAPSHRQKEAASKFSELKELGILFKEIVLSKKDGTELDVELYGTALKDENFLGTVRDISPRKEIERKLRESEETYRNLVEMSPNAIVVHREGKLTFINQAGVKLYGAEKAEDLLGKNALNFVHPDSRPLAVKRITELLQNKRPVDSMYEKMFRADGSIAHVEVAAAPFQADSGSVQVVIRDITRRMELEQELRDKSKLLEEQLYFSEALNNLADSILSNDHTNQSLHSITRIVSDTLHAECYLLADGELKSSYPEEQVTEEPELEIIKSIYDIRLEEKKVYYSHKDAVNEHLVTHGLGEFLHQKLDIHSLYWYPFSTGHGGYNCIAISECNSKRILKEKELIFLKDASRLVEIAIMKMKYYDYQKTTVEALRQSKEKYKELFENANDIIYTTDLDGKFISVNHAGLRTLGYSLEEILNYDLTKIVHPDYLDICLNYFNQKLTGSRQTTGPYELLAVTKDGRKIWIEVSTRLIREAGIPIGLQGIARDVSDRKRMMESIKKAEYEKDLILSSISESVVFFDRDIRIRWANAMAVETHKIPADRMVGHHCYELWKNQSSPCPNCPVAKVLESGERAIGEIDHEDMTWHIKAFPVFDEDKKIIGVVEFAKDITEKKKMEIEMERFERMNLIGEMAAGFGHEIRNPMAVVKGFLQMLNLKNDFDSYRHYFEIMIEEIDRANSIITEYLSLARNKAVDLKNQSLNPIIESLYPLILADAIHGDKSIKLELQDMPPINIDKNDIHQLILNLVRNGLESMTKGGLLTISTYRDGNDIVMAVKDQGKGIDPSILPKLGMPFITTKENGTGMGLAICYSVANRNKACIEVDTGVSGTTFNIRFPVKCDN